MISALEGDFDRVYLSQPKTKIKPQAVGIYITKDKVSFAVKSPSCKIKGIFYYSSLLSTLRMELLRRKMFSSMSYAKDFWGMQEAFYNAFAEPRQFIQTSIRQVRLGIGHKFVDGIGKVVGLI